MKSRRPWSQPLADLVAPCLRPALAEFGFDQAHLLLDWPDIVGGRLAAHCQPLRLQWPRRRGQGVENEAATLIVRVEGPFAIELQHQEPTVIERINAHVGWRCVGRIALRQGPLPARSPPRTRPRPPSERALAEARVQTAAIGDEGLRAALARLGARVAERGGSAT